MLGIDKSATPDQIKKVFRRLAVKFHPDVNPGIYSDDEFKKINTAYQILSNDHRRALFDAGSFDPDDAFDQDVDLYEFEKPLKILLIRDRQAIECQFVTERVESDPRFPIPIECQVQQYVKELRMVFKAPAHLSSTEAKEAVAAYQDSVLDDYDGVISDVTIRSVG